MPLWQPIVQGRREQQRLVHIRGSKALSHGRILSPNTLWKSCQVWCLGRIYSRQTPSNSRVYQRNMDDKQTPWEDHLLERKTDRSSADIRRTAVAFANSVTPRANAS